MFLFGGVAVYVLIHQLSGVGNLVEQIGDLTGTGFRPSSVSPSSPTSGRRCRFRDRCPCAFRPWPTFLSQLAGSFANRVTPVSVGGMAVGIRLPAEGRRRPTGGGHGRGPGLAVRLRRPRHADARLRAVRRPGGLRRHPPAAEPDRARRRRRHPRPLRHRLRPAGRPSAGLRQVGPGSAPAVQGSSRLPPTPPSCSRW